MSKPYDIEQLLRECAEEKIHLIGEVQGFADLIAIDSNFVLKAMSENFAINGVAPKLGARFSELLNSEDLAKLQSLMGVENLRAGSLLDLNVGKFYCYRVKGLLVLERELYSDEIDNTQRQHLFNIIPNIAFAIDSEKELQSAAQNVATAVKNLLGYDRVMIYRFHPDDHGEVIAEEKEKSLEPFINLHYPESDIPQQARALFLRNQVRIIEVCRSAFGCGYVDTETAGQSAADQCVPRQDQTMVGHWPDRDGGDPVWSAGSGHS